jgi:hypothetical protein
VTLLKDCSSIVTTNAIGVWSLKEAKVSNAPVEV